MIELFNRRSGGGLGWNGSWRGCRCWCRCWLGCRDAGEIADGVNAEGVGVVAGEILQGIDVIACGWIAVVEADAGAAVDDVVQRQDNGLAGDSGGIDGDVGPIAADGEG